MLALMAGGAVVIQRGQAADLEQVVRTDLPNTLRLQKVSERITAVHGELYFLLTHQAAAIDVDKIEGKSQALLAEVDAITKEVQAIQANAPASQKKNFADLVKALKQTRDALDVIAAMITTEI